MESESDIVHKRVTLGRHRSAPAVLSTTISNGQIERPTQPANIEQIGISCPGEHSFARLHFATLP